MWEYKPPWCQPWTIVSTGIVLITSVNLISHQSYLMTGLIAIPIFVWWYIFLILVPQEFKQYVHNATKDAG